MSEIKAICIIVGVLLSCGAIGIIFSRFISSWREWKINHYWEHGE